MDQIRTRYAPMSNAPHYPRQTNRDEETTTDRLLQILESARSMAVQQTRAVGFWSAIALPFLYVPVLAAGLETMTEATAVIVLLSLNLLAVLIGRGYKAD